MRAPFLMVKLAGMEKVEKVIVRALFTGIFWWLADRGRKSSPKVELCFLTFLTETAFPRKENVDQRK